MQINSPIYYSFKNDSPYTNEAKWVINVLSSYAGIELINKQEEKNITIEINSVFFDKVYSKSAISQAFLNDEMEISLSDGSIDFISTIFYFLNCLWEREQNATLDHWGRSDFSGSIWDKFQHKRPIKKVNQLFDSVLNEWGIPLPKKPSSVFLSHDIDVVYGAYFEDGMALAKKGQYGKMLKQIKDHFIKGPQWFNFRTIANLELKYGLNSTFFWIPLKGKVEGVGKNADYSLKNKAISTEINWLKNEGFSHGIHKSIASSSLKEEVELMQMDILSNRYHYLKFDFEHLKKEMNAAGLLMDASLGYAEVPGYRNGYTLPFIPFDLENRTPCRFVEVPLTIMDGTFSKYQKSSGKEAFAQISDFIDEHEQNCVISILWHNSHFTDFKYEGYPEVYEQVLKIIHEKSLKSVSPKELIERYLKDA